MRVSNENKISIHCLLACLYFLLLPTTIAINSSGNSILKLATIPIGGYFIVTLFLSKQEMHINSVHLTLLAYTFSTLLTLLIDASGLAKDYVIGYFLNAALYICLSAVKYNCKELDLMESTQIVLLLILNVMTLFSGAKEDNRTTLVIMGQTSDPNYFTGFFIFPLCVVLKRIADGKWRIVNIALAFVSLYSIFLSGSRGGLLSVIVSLAAFAVIYPKGLGPKLGILLGGTVFLVIVWTVLMPLLPETIVDRLSVDAVIETGGTGRLDIWKSMMLEIWQNPDKLLFGRGIHAVHRLFVNGKWGDTYAHNQLLQVLYNQGIVGLVLFLILTITCFFRCVKQRKAVAVAIIGMMVLSFTLSFNQTTRTFWNLVAYSALVFPEDPNTPPPETL